ncbi:very short patch repair endonuclease [Rhizobium sp. LjRoot258]|uniref:very short patch repair endonuclease n=1 Tax=Rhizobium sp. LjRoot258 TaxID=3342299 RepID=UPI003ECF05AB
MDRLTPERRSANMARIRGKDTKPEMVVRRLVHSLGYRYRLHRPGLPGKPDLVFPSRMAIIFVHGCFWHRHPSCKNAVLPKTRTEFWEAKMRRNVERDTINIAKLEEQGYRVEIIWECETKDLSALTRRIVHFLGDPNKPGRPTVPA